MQKKMVTAAAAAALAVLMPAAAQAGDGVYDPPYVAEQIQAAAELATDANQLARQLDFRRTFGLNDDEVYVTGLLAAPEGLDTTYGALLTPEEQDDMDQRFAVADSLHEVDAYAAQAAPDTYAGVYTDQAAGGLVYVGFTSDGARHLSELRKRFSYPGRLRLFPATRTLAQLRTVLDDVTAALPQLRDAGVDVRIAALNTAANSVDVSLETPSAVADQELQSRFGSVVRVTGTASPSTTDRTNDGVPFKGGIEEYDTRVSCTSAFVMRRQTGSLLSLQPYDYFMLTAGHCFPLNTRVFHFIHTLGTVTQNSWPGINGGSTTDAELIDIAPGTESRQLLRSNPSTYVTMTGQLTNNADYRDGDPSCLVGKTSGYGCGTIVTADTVVTYAGPRTLTRQVIGSIDSCPGDSGGAEFRGSTALGIVSGRVDSRLACGASDAIYSKISEATANHNVLINR